VLRGSCDGEGSEGIDECQAVLVICREGYVGCMSLWRATRAHKRTQTNIGLVPKYFSNLRTNRRRPTQPTTADSHRPCKIRSKRIQSTRFGPWDYSPFTSQLYSLKLCRTESHFFEIRATRIYSALLSTATFAKSNPFAHRIQSAILKNFQYPSFESRPSLCVSYSESCSNQL
jgi:hypothetical protein